MPAFFGQSKTLFCSEGSKVAVLVKTTNGKRREQSLNLSTPEAALAWCRTEKAVMVYLPAQIAGN